MTSLSLVVAYQMIASGVASIIHFMYPLAVALAMVCFFRERGSAVTFAAIGLSIVGAVLLSSGSVGFARGNALLGTAAAVVSVFSYGGYIVGVRRSRAVTIPSTVLTTYVMAFGALFFLIGASLTGGVRSRRSPVPGSQSSASPCRPRPCRTWRSYRRSRRSVRRSPPYLAPWSR